MTLALLLPLVGLLVFVALGYRRKWLRAEALWQQAAIKHMDPHRVLADLFAPSTTRDVSRQQAWRERRAMTSPDHTTRHEVEDIPNEPFNDSFAARQIMGLCIGEREVDE